MRLGCQRAGLLAAPKRCVIVGTDEVHPTLAHYHQHHYIAMLSGKTVTAVNAPLPADADPNGDQYLVDVGWSGPGPASR
jgi:hypothetical protein